ncbi:hypothetical protein CU097_008261 [Rhizopus azygosporus]|uniref:Uncharacterized protein n=1 Tax=Rhizopus azygosporus TaxID=86630 RepID=A0A367J7L9_RHIAZ|nr:hypothetical protein CU097_008261 [Rhizopus azygosporus]
MPANNNHIDANPGHNDDEDRHGVVEHDEHTLSDDLFPNSIWVAPDGTSLAELRCLFKAKTLKLRNPVEQLSDLRHLVLHDIYFFDVNKQESSVSKGWYIDIHRQVMATLSTYEPPKALNSIHWCIDISLTKHDNWMMPLATAAIHLVQAIATNNMVDVHTIQAMV